MVPAPYSAMTVVPCANAMGLANRHAGVTASMPANRKRTRFIGTSRDRSERGRPMAPPGDNFGQTMGGGLSGGSASDARCAGGLAGTRNDVTRVAGTSKDGMAPTVAVQLLRQTATL